MDLVRIKHPSDENARLSFTHSGPDEDGGYLLPVNRVPEAVSLGWEVSHAPPKEKPWEPGDPPRTDGPTIEVWVKAGYKAEDYPPEGFEEKPSEGLAAFRAEQAAAKTAADALAAAEAAKVDAEKPGTDGEAEKAQKSARLKINKDQK
jgi:hypothetical protein